MREKIQINKILVQLQNKKYLTYAVKYFSIENFADIFYINQVG